MWEMYYFLIQSDNNQTSNELKEQTDWKEKEPIKIVHFVKKS